MVLKMLPEDVPKDKYVEVNGLRLHYLDWGNRGAQPMILIHGLQQCAHSWDFFATRMQPSFHVLALDQRGHGDSAWAQGKAYKFDDYVAEISGFIKSLRLSKVVLVGHSAGGRYSMAYAAQHPRKVDRLIIVDIDPDSSKQEASHRFDRQLSRSDKWESLDDLLGRLRRRYPNVPGDVLHHHALHLTQELPGGRRKWKRDRAILEVYERPDIWGEFSRIRCPTLIVRGRNSRILTHETAVKMKETLQGCRLAELEDGGHWVYDEVPGSFEAAVRWFLAD
ncbi:MAG: alpha/beta hydrolase [Chloroflexi bacterium]|nr:alpha/beta hydrolase [Chloroflexota bacterium]